MCDYSKYSIVEIEHCFSVPKVCITQQQDRNRPENDAVLCFRTLQTSWEFIITYDRDYDVSKISIKNIHGRVIQSEVNEPLAEIVIWRWNNYKQEIIKKELFKRNESKQVLPSYQRVDIHFSVRLIAKRKLETELCPPLDYLVSDAFTISVGEQNFIVSAQRLMQISPVFRAMLTNELSEKASRKVEVKDAEPEHFRAFLEVIDPDQNAQPNPTNVVGVLKLADRYQVNLAKDRCEWHLLHCVEVPLIERLQLAGFYGLNKLKDSILSIGSVNLRAFYKANYNEMQNEEQLSRKLLNELTLRLCDKE